MWSVNRAADGMDILQRKSLQSLVYSETLPLANYNHCMAVLHQHHCGTTPEAQGTFLELSWYHPGDIPSAGWRSPLPTAGIFPEKNMWCQMDVRPACSYAILASLHQNLMRGFDFTWWDLATVGWERSSCCPSVSLLLGEERREECLSSLHSLGAESKPFLCWWQSPSLWQGCWMASGRQLWVWVQCCTSGTCLGILEWGNGQTLLFGYRKTLHVKRSMITKGKEKALFSSS